MVDCLNPGTQHLIAWDISDMADESTGNMTGNPYRTSIERVYDRNG